MADFPDSGVSFPNRAEASYPTFTSPVIERWNEMQLEQSASETPKARDGQDIVSEVFSRLLNIGCDTGNPMSDRIQALEAAWRVYADFARFVNGN